MEETLEVNKLKTQDKVMIVITEEKVREFLRKKVDGSLYHREQKDLEFKESFNLNGLGEYFRDFAGFANNSGGFIIFGVTNSPRRLKGLTKKGLDQFNIIDPEKISCFLNEHFSPYINWELGVIDIGKKSFGVLYAFEVKEKPVICKKGEGKYLKNGDVYYRYAGRTEVIQYAELASIIAKRIDENNKLWLEKVKTIGAVGPSNVGILDTLNGTVEGSKGSLLIDRELLKEIRFLKEGEFKEKRGAKALKLIGSVEPIGTVEVAKIIKRKLIDDYPYSYSRLQEIIKQEFPSAKVSRIQDIIKENELKNDSRYSAYNFRNKDQEEAWKEAEKKPKNVPSIYNEAAKEFIIKILESEKQEA